MRPLRPLLALTCLGLALTAQAAQAKIPDPRFSEHDPALLAGPGGTHAYRVLLREVNNAPLYTVQVTLDFSGTSARLYAVQEPGTTLDCASRTLTRLTDTHGIALFHPRLGGCLAGLGMRVIADGISMWSVPVRSTDLDGLDGCTGLGDLGRFAPMLLDHSSGHAEADFDNSGGPIGLGDLVIFAGDLLSGAKGAYCP